MNCVCQSEAKLFCTNRPVFLDNISLSLKNLYVILYRVRDSAIQDKIELLFIDIRFFRESQILKYFFSIVLIIFRTLV